MWTRYDALAPLTLFALLTTACGPREAPPEADVESPPPTPIVEPAWFEEITDTAGLDFVHETGARGELQLP
jgi:hypothetical protein